MQLFEILQNNFRTLVLNINILQAVNLHGQKKVFHDFKECVNDTNIVTPWRGLGLFEYKVSSRFSKVCERYFLPIDYTWCRLKNDSTKILCYQQQLYKKDSSVQSISSVDICRMEDNIQTKRKRWRGKMEKLVQTTHCPDYALFLFMVGVFRSQCSLQIIIQISTWNKLISNRQTLTDSISKKETFW